MPTVPLGKGINREGPEILCSIIGRPAGSIADFSYSDAMKASAARGLTWKPATIVQYLANPRAFLVAYLGAPDLRNKMRFMLENLQDREDVVAIAPPTAQ